MQHVLRAGGDLLGFAGLEVVGVDNQGVAGLGDDDTGIALTQAAGEAAAVSPARAGSMVRRAWAMVRA